MPAVVHTTSSNSQSPTIPSTTAGHALVVCVMGSDRGAPPVVTGVTLGGSATGWVPLEASDDSFGDTFAACWANYSIAGGQTAVVISGTDLDTASGTGGVVVYEVSGVLTTAALDQVSTDNTSDFSPTAAYTSGPTPPATTQASEIWIGCANADGGSITGPSAWTNTAPAGGAAVAGYQVVTSTGTPIYAGSCTSGGWSASVVALKGAGSAGAAAQLHGAGTLTAAGDAGAAAQLHGAGTLTAGAAIRVPGAAQLHGAGTLTAGAAIRVPGAAQLHGGGTLTASPTYTTSGAAQLHGGGTVHATATVTAPGGTAAAPPPLDGYRRLLRRRAHRILGMRL